MLAALADGGPVATRFKKLDKIPIMVDYKSVGNINIRGWAFFCNNSGTDEGHLAQSYAPHTLGSKVC